ncbi:MAG TPA: hypothetical protein VJT85_08390 [Gemmatimonadaceae bacterium]|nr:hypothetical protein [Gemmatimonadaceae bacterium]
MACAASDIAGPVRDGSPVQTDAVVYRLRRMPGAYEATALATYVNRTGSPVYFQRCHPSLDGPIFGYFRTGPDSTRSLFTDTAWGCVGGMPPGVILPGDSVTVAVRLGAFDQPSMTPPLRPEEIVGQMRIWLSLCARPSADSGDCKSLPIEERQSNAFEVRY